MLVNSGVRLKVDQGQHQIGAPHHMSIDTEK